MRDVPTEHGLAMYRLAELGVACELALVDRRHHQQKRAAYFALNPQGVIPTLVDGELILTEAAAICMHLVDRHPDRDLAPLNLELME